MLFEDHGVMVTEETEKAEDVLEDKVEESVHEEPIKTLINEKKKK